MSLTKTVNVPFVSSECRFWEVIRKGPQVIWAKPQVDADLRLPRSAAALPDMPHFSPDPVRGSRKAAETSDARCRNMLVALFSAYALAHSRGGSRRGQKFSRRPCGRREQYLRLLRRGLRNGVAGHNGSAGRAPSHYEICWKQKPPGQLRPLVHQGRDHRGSRACLTNGLARW